MHRSLGQKDIEIDVQIFDETGKVPLPKVKEEGQYTLFRSVLEEIGIDYEDEAVMIDSYLDWIDEDSMVRLNGAEEIYYQNKSPARRPTNSSLNGFDDFSFIRGYEGAFFNKQGFPNDKFQKFREAVTLQNIVAVNINTANPLVRAALAHNTDFDWVSFNIFIAGEDGILGTDDDTYISSADELAHIGLNLKSNNIGFKVEMLKVIIRLNCGEKFFQLTSLIRVNNNKISSTDKPSDKRVSDSFEVLRLIENADYE